MTMTKSKVSVLVIEDNPLQAAQVTNVITKFTDDIVMVLTAERGLATFKGSVMMDQPFDILVTDILLPGMDGKELIREVREIEQDFHEVHAKIIAMSADDPKNQVIEACKVGADSYLEKPFTNEKLEEMLVETGLFEVEG